MPAFVAAVAAQQAAELVADVHVWRLPYQRAHARGPLRLLLASYLDIDAAAVCFEQGNHGRPTLSSPHHGLHFNWSHSGNFALVAIARDLPFLGVDVETSRARPRALALAQRYFSRSEYAWLATLRPDACEIAFLRLWTAKEAVLKALGEGLQYGLHRVAFTLLHGMPHGSEFQGAAAPAGDWTLRAIDGLHGYASIAWRGPPRPIRWLHPAAN